MARTIILQTLYQWDFNNKDNKQILIILKHVLKDFAPELNNQDFIEKIINGIIKNLKEINQYIQKYAPEWPIENITVIDRNVLRIGIYELLFLQKFPLKWLLMKV